MNKRTIITLMALLATILSTSIADAATTPAAGDMAYDLYDIVMNKIIGGPVGYVIGAGGVGFAIGNGMFGSNMRYSIIASALSAV